MQTSLSTQLDRPWALKPTCARSSCGPFRNHSLVQRRSKHWVVAAKDWKRDSQAESQLIHDPEGFLTGFQRAFFSSAPRIRVRRANDRALDQLADLAVLNERLARAADASHDSEDGDAAFAAALARRRVDYLKRRRRKWELVYKYVTEHDALCTLGAIEEANRKVEEALSEESRDRMGITALKRRLQGLQEEVGQAHARLHETQRRVVTNLKKITELKEEAKRLQSIHDNTEPSSTALQMNYTTPVPSVDAVYLGQGTEPGKLKVRDENEMNERTSTYNRHRGLKSSNELEEELRNYWFPVQFSGRVTEGMMFPFELFGEPWVLFRDEKGQPAVVRDECAHRACPLSLGSVVNGQVQCAYHGWRFNGQGDCTAMPSTTFCRGVGVAALPTCESEGLVWVWPGFGAPDEGMPMAAVTPPAGYAVHAEIEMEVPVEHGLLIENLLDLAHAPFTHTTTFARGWPVPEIVQFNAGRMLSGHWQPYPIDMEFHPPCITASLIGLAQPGQIERGSRAGACRNHLHQVHMCLPSKAGHTRLLYRMSMDFMGWVRWVPGIQNAWKGVAAQVLGEDLKLVLGQQDRMLRGGDTWAFPVSYDKLAVRYRRWRNSTAGQKRSEEMKSQLASREKLHMSAEELFAVEE